MDESFLSDPRVVKASRDFVCIRLVTYESAEEAKFLKAVFRTRSDDLENTVFVLLAPDGKQKLSEAGRSPGMVFRGPLQESVPALIAKMAQVAQRYPGRSGVQDQAPVPYHRDFRRGLNVAACDLQPLLVVCAPSDCQRQEIEELLAPLLWEAEFVGQFAPTHVEDSSTLKLEGHQKVSARQGELLIVQPDPYGVKGEVLVQQSDLNSKALREALLTGLKKFQVSSKNSRRHVAEGMRRGISWESEIPPTDPGERER
jgi:hypothetical protein